jgi:hypothetical protein
MRLRKQYLFPMLIALVLGLSLFSVSATSADEVPTELPVPGYILTEDAPVTRMPIMLSPRCDYFPYVGIVGRARARVVNSGDDGLGTFIGVVRLKRNTLLRDRGSYTVSISERRFADEEGGDGCTTSVTKTFVKRYHPSKRVRFAVPLGQGEHRFVQIVIERVNPDGTPGLTWATDYIDVAVG